MPFKKYYKKKPQSYRKRGRKMAIPRKVQSRYDGINYVKIVDVTNFIYTVNIPLSYNMAAFTSQWGSRDVLANSYARVSDADEWVNLCTKYRYYKITGMKISYTPLCQVNTAADTAIIRGQYGTSIGENFTIATGARYIEESEGYTTFDPSKPFERYVPVKTFFKGINQEWLTTNTPYDAASCHLRVYAINYANAAVIGTVTTTWYVQCKQFAF